MLKGWSGYFDYGTCTPAYRAIDNHVMTRVQHFLVKRHRVPSRGTARFSRDTVFGELGVLSLRARQAVRPPSWALR
jgi:RNA-directed DNA polymerase